VIYERPSRTSRVLVVAFSLLVFIFAGWMLAPIMLAHYPSAVAAVPILRDLVGQNGTPEPQPMAEPMAALAPEPSPANEVALKAGPEPAPAFPSPPATEARPAPADRSPDSTHSYSPTEASTRATADMPVAVAVPPGLLPWPGADSSAASAEPEVAEVTTGTLGEPDDAAPVPLPRPRPSAASLARLTVPRPRPDEAPSVAEESPIPDDVLFDRLTQPN
jgi:hypothetical protein